MFRACVSIPANAVSAIAVEAYKKMLLVALIADGGANLTSSSPPTPPKVRSDSANFVCTNAVLRSLLLLS